MRSGTRTGLVLALALVGALAAGASAGQPSADEQQALRARIEAGYDVVPLSDGVALRPKTRRSDVRLVEITDTIAINGSPVTGLELRDRLGEDADVILKLSYLDPAARRALFERGGSAPGAAPETTPPPVVDPPAPPDPPAREVRRDRSGGDRVRIFGNVRVDEGETIDGQAVAVMGSVRVDGEVGDQVVAVLGSVDLGPNAVVDGDVVSVGGRVNRSPGARIRGSVTEVALGSGVGVAAVPWMAGLHGFDSLGPWSAVPRLVGTIFRLVLLLLFTGLALVVARSAVERAGQRASDDPVKSTLVGIVAQILVLPLFILTAIVLALTIVGIPLLILLPFAALGLLLLALVGFTGTAGTIGGRVRRRFNWGAQSEFADVAVGLLTILLPLLVARLLALAGWWSGPFVFLLVGVGLVIEYLAWSCGFGAVLTNEFTRWQARRTARTTAASAVTTTTTTTTEP
jgi:hypothetical protein